MPILRPDTLKGVDDLIRATHEAFREACFNWLLVATALVVIGLVLEGPELSHEISSIIRNWRFNRKFHFSLPEQHAPDWVKLLAFVGWILIVLGVGGEFIADSFVSKADGYVQTFDEILLHEAQTRTAFASERASAAYERAAETEREAAAENAIAAKSLAEAETARKEAEGFQLRIAEANERAASAEKNAAEAQLELGRLKSPRSLTHVPEMVLSLKQFEGTEYTFSFVFQDEDSIKLLRAIDDLLHQAGWKRLKPPHGFPALNVFPGENDTAVKVGIATGLLVSVQSQESLEVLQKKNSQELPSYIRAADAVNLALSSNVFPHRRPRPRSRLRCRKATPQLCSSESARSPDERPRYPLRPGPMQLPGPGMAFPQSTP